MSGDYVNQVTLSSGLISRILESGKGARGDTYYLLSYLLGKMDYEVLVFDKLGKLTDFTPFRATIYGALTKFKGRQVVRANNLVNNSKNKDSFP